MTNRALGVTLLAVSLATFPALARADDDGPEAPVPGPPPPSAPARTAESAMHPQLQLDFKLATGIASLVGLVPQLLVGARFGRFTAQLGFGLTRGDFTTTSSNGGGATRTVDTAGTIYTGAPTFTFDVFRTSDQKVAVYVVAALILGGFTATQSDSARTMADPCDSNSTFFIGYQLGLGGRVALHRNFHLGLEAGPTGLFAAFGDNSCVRERNGVAVTSVYGALVGTVLIP